MKRINSFADIDWSIPANRASIVYVLYGGVLIYLSYFLYNDKIDVIVTNTNYKPEEFIGKSFGGRYNTADYYKPLIEEWVRRSEISIEEGMSWKEEAEFEERLNR